MANTFKNAAAAATGTSEVSVYTVPSSTTTTVIGLTCANVTSTSPIYADIRVYDSSGTAHYYVEKYCRQCYWQYKNCSKFNTNSSYR
jgi:hypothetical protein